MMAHLELLARNRQPHEDRVAVKYLTLDAAVAEFTRKMEQLEEAQDRLSRCTCDSAPGFEINTRRDRQCDAELMLARWKRMAAEERGCL